MVRKLLLLLAGVGLLLLGLIGLVLPVLPGVLLLIGAAGCFSLASDRFHAALGSRLERHPRHRLAWRRWQASSGMPLWRRAQLGFWLTLASVLPGGSR
ncbi:MAG: DUF454 family protein [Pseudomonadales bacterium]